jgi:tRNA(Ile)-lysidine synthase
MLDKFLSYINQEKLFLPIDKILLAVSGGMDSMVMVRLFRDANVQIGIAHVNHNLRGEESQQDEDFIKNYCETYHLPFFVASIDPKTFDRQNMHEKARQFRYDFFEKVMTVNDYQYVATAHHQDDVVETFLMNMSRGAGLNGLSSIPSKRQHIIRPILFATKEDITNFVTIEKIQFREDSSNASDKYLRNSLRHHIVPALYELEPRARQGIPQTIANIKTSFELLTELTNIVKENMVKKQKDEIVIDLMELNKLQNATSFLFQIIQEYGYNYDQCVDILSDHDQNSRFFLTKTHETLLDRNKLHIRPIQVKTDDHAIFQLDLNTEVTIANKKIKLETVESHTITFDNNNNIQYIGIDHLSLPFNVRKWQAGDTFAPLGLKGKKQKLQDFLINNKLSLHEKSNVVVIVSGDKIISIPGYRISEDVKVTEHSKLIARVSMGEVE